MSEKHTNTKMDYEEALNTKDHEVPESIDDQNKAIEFAYLMGELIDTDKVVLTQENVRELVNYIKELES